MTTHVEKLCQMLESMNPNASDLSVRVCWAIGRDLREAINKDKETSVIDFKGKFYKNCKVNRKKKAKICDVCPFRKGIEEQEQHD